MISVLPRVVSSVIHMTGVPGAAAEDPELFDLLREIGRERERRGDVRQRADGDDLDFAGVFAHKIDDRLHRVLLLRRPSRSGQVESAEAVFPVDAVRREALFRKQRMLHAAIDRREICSRRVLRQKCVFGA